MLKNYQERVRVWVEERSMRDWSPHVVLSCLAEENGELARAVHHVHGPKPRKPGDEDDDISGELGDVLFLLCDLANKFGIDLDDSIEAALTKCYGRDADRYKKAEQEEEVWLAVGLPEKLPNDEYEVTFYAYKHLDGTSDIVHGGHSCVVHEDSLQFGKRVLLKVHKLGLRVDGLRLIELPREMSCGYQRIYVKEDQLHKLEEQSDA